eukprot:3444166-Prymnesium_polylepis.1
MVGGGSRLRVGCGSMRGWVGGWTGVARGVRCAAATAHGGPARGAPPPPRACTWHPGLRVRRAPAARATAARGSRDAQRRARRRHRAPARRL